MLRYIGLDKMNVGDKAYVIKLLSDSAIRRRFLDIGLTENTWVECVGKSPLGDPKAYLIRGAVIAIRGCDVKDVQIKYVSGGCKDGIN